MMLPSASSTASWQAASYSLMNWPSSMSVRGIQICWPKQCVIRLASVVLPLPGAPYRNMPAPEFTAGPSRSSSSDSMLMPRKAANELLAAGGFGPNRLGLDRHDVFVERHRHRAQRRHRLASPHELGRCPCSVSA